MPDFLNNSEPEFELVCTVEDLEERKGREFFINETEVAVFKVNGVVYALHNVCLHQHQAIIHDGFVEGGYVVCPAHAWKFSLANGKQPGDRRGLDCYPVEIRGEDVFIKVHKKSFKF